VLRETSRISNSGRMKTIAEDFDACWKEDVNGCWIWQRARNGAGYGVLSVNRKLVLAHRFSYERCNGPIPAGMFLCHTCDVPGCVNPQHVWPGWPRDNTQDSIKKGRARRGIHRGEANVTAKLTAADVKAIRARVATGETQSAVAKDYGLHKTNVQCIVSRKTWKHIA